MNNGSNNKISPARLSALAFPVILWISLVLFSSHILTRVESRSLFLFDWDWFCGFLDVPGGFLTWISLFFTQFLHMPWLGALLWSVLLTLAAELTRSMFNIPLRLAAFAYVPAFVLVAANMSLGYFIYIIRTPGYFFSPVLGYLSILGIVALLRKTGRPFTYLAIPFLGAAGYLLFGAYTFVGIATFALESLFNESRWSRKSAVLLLSAAVIAVLPTAFYGLTTFRPEEGWTIGLPRALYSETVFRLRFPYVLAILFIPIFSLTGRLTDKIGRYHIALQSATVAACALATFLFWNRDTNFNAEIKMMNAADRLEWNKTARVLENLADKADKDVTYSPTRVMVLLKDLALLKNGTELDRMFTYEDGDQAQKNSMDIPMVLEIGKILYLHYGIPGFCHRWCLEEAGEFGWSSSLLQYAIMASLTMEDVKVADKYLSKLDKTLFYRNWARSQRELCQDTGKIAVTAPYDKIMPLICYEDRLADDQRGCEYFLTSHFAEARPRKASAFYDRVALMWALKSHQSAIFWPKLLQYLESGNSSDIPVHCQEAAYLFSNVGEDRLEIRFPFDRKVTELFNATLQQISSNGITTPQDARQELPQRIRHTYFYYYFFFSNPETF